MPDRHLLLGLGTPTPWLGTKQRANRSASINSTCFSFEVWGLWLGQVHHNGGTVYRSHRGLISDRRWVLLLALGLGMVGTETGSSVPSSTLGVQAALASKWVAASWGFMGFGAPLPVGAENVIRIVDLDFRWVDPGDEDGVWHSPSSTLPSFAYFSWFVSLAMDGRTWPSRSSCSATRLPSCAGRWPVRRFSLRIGQCSLD